MAETINKNVVLLIAVLASFVTSINITAINVALPSIGNEFGLSAPMLGWMANAYILAQAALLVPFGRMADLFGRMRIFKIGLLISVATFSLCLIVQSSSMLLVLRIFQGVGSAMIAGTGMAIVTLVFPINERGRALGVTVTGVYLGMAFGPSIGGVLTSQFGWRSVFVAFAIISLVLVVMVFWKVKRDWAEARGQHFDLTGSIVLAISMAMVMYGFSELPSGPAIGIIIVGMAGLWGFVWWEARNASPILNVILLKNNKAFIFSNLACLTNYVLLGAMMLLINLYLQYAKGYSPQHAGFILLANSVVLSVMATFAGRLADKFAPHKIATIGLAVNALTAVIFTLLTPVTSLGWIICSLVVAGFGHGLFSTPNSKVVLSSVNRDTVSVATSTQSATRSVGAASGAGFAIILFSIYLGTAQISSETVDPFLSSMRTAFIVTAVLCALGIGFQMAGKSQAG